MQDVRFISDRTIYARFGDLVAWLSLAFTVAALLATRRVRVLTVAADGQSRGMRSPRGSRRFKGIPEFLRGLRELRSLRDEPSVVCWRGDSQEFSPLALQLDDQLRRYEDLARRASDLRSHL